jgi:heme-degrading monooxygenase HmoA
MQIVIFRNHLRDDAEDYPAEAAAIGALARAQPGIIGFKTFTAADGERVTIAEFESAEAVVAWREHPRHREAQRKGRSDFYSEYKLQICDVVREQRFIQEKQVHSERSGKVQDFPGKEA